MLSRPCRSRWFLTALLALLVAVAAGCPPTTTVRETKSSATTEPGKTQKQEKENGSPGSMKTPTHTPGG